MKAIATPSMATSDVAVESSLKPPILLHFTKHEVTTKAIPTIKKMTFMIPSTIRVITPQALPIFRFLYIYSF